MFGLEQILGRDRSFGLGVRGQVDIASSILVDLPDLDFDNHSVVESPAPGATAGGMEAAIGALSGGMTAAAAVQAGVLEGFPFLECPFGVARSPGDGEALGQYT